MIEFRCSFSKSFHFSLALHFSIHFFWFVCSRKKLIISIPRKKCKYVYSINRMVFTTNEMVALCKKHLTTKKKLNCKYSFLKVCDAEHSVTELRENLLKSTFRFVHLRKSVRCCYFIACFEKHCLSSALFIFVLRLSIQSNIILN